MLDPKNYKFLPHHYTNVIRAAGKFTHKSEQLGNLMTWQAEWYEMNYYTLNNYDCLFIYNRYLKTLDHITYT